MSESSPDPRAQQERIERLERSVLGLKVGLCVVSAALVLLVIPPIRAAVTWLLIIALIGGGVLVLITALICLLDYLFPANRNESKRDQSR